jgi:hypothetical protein
MKSIKPINEFVLSSADYSPHRKRLSNGKPDSAVPPRGIWVFAARFGSMLPIRNGDRRAEPGLTSSAPRFTLPAMTCFR